LIVKLILILIVQVMMMREIRHSLMTLVFVCDPSTWVNRVQPNFVGRFQMFYLNRFAPLFMLLSVTAAAGQFLIANAISQVSLAIIFAAEKLTDAIFNSLALTFIIDLDEALWKVLELNFNIKIREGFKYEQERPSGRQRGCHREVNRLGFSALLSRRTIVTCILSGFYCRQVFSVLIIVHERILPTTFHACDMWRMMEDKSDASFMSKLMRPIMKPMLSPIEGRVLQVATGNRTGLEYQKIGCDPSLELSNTRVSANKTLFSNFSDLVLNNNKTVGVCHCEALEGVWEPRFWSERAGEMIRKHHIISGIGFSCALIFVFLPVLIDFIVQYHEEKHRDQRKKEQAHKD